MVRILDKYEQDIYDTRLDLEADTESWKNCGPCAQSIKPVIKYVQCFECKHFSQIALDKLTESDRYHDLDLELEQDEQLLKITSCY
jgi:hypothetical protein